MSPREARQAGADDLLGMRWWNGLSVAERRHWLDLAWRRNQSLTGRISYALEDMPSAADAWAAFKAAAP